MMADHGPGSRGPRGRGRDRAQPWTARPGFGSTTLCSRSRAARTCCTRTGRGGSRSWSKSTSTSTSCAPPRCTSARRTSLIPPSSFARAPLLPRPRQQLRRPRRARACGGRRSRPRKLGAPGRTSPTCSRRRHAGVVRRRAAHRARSTLPTGTCSCTATLEQRSLTPDRAGDRRRARARPARGGPARRRPGAHHRARGFGQDARAHRTVPAARARADWSIGRSPRSRTTCAPRTRCGARLADLPDRPRKRSARCTRSATTSCAAADRQRRR